MLKFNKQKIEIYEFLTDCLKTHKKLQNKLV